MEIVKYPNDILRVKSTDADIESEETRTVVENLLATFGENDALGLSACQIGYNKNIFVCTPKREGLITVINPIVVAKSGNYWSREEGCMSLPGVRIDIKRKKFIKIKYTDIYGEEQWLRKENFEAVIIQHELDHLNGKLIIDYS